MSRLLVLFGTTDGQTRKVAWAIGDVLETCGCSVDVLDARQSGGSITAESYDAVIVAASLHARGYQRVVERWVRRNAVALGRRPTAFISVCLGMLEQYPGTRHDLDTIVQTFQGRTRWRPDVVRLVGGALRYTRYGWLKKLMMKRIAAKAGGGTDTTRDYEYTDWKALDGFVRDFAWRHGCALLQPPVPAAPPALSVVAPQRVTALVGTAH
jgi:menaquinone-dependent protoporphyrinogen oxidase